MTPSGVDGIPIEGSLAKGIRNRRAMALSPPSDDSPRGRFAALLRHHMEVGTRPAGKRGSGPWSVNAVADAINVGERTVQNYRSGSTLPPDVSNMLDAFFGDDPRHTAARAAFLVAFNEARGIPTPPPPFKPIHPELHSIGELFTGRDEFLDRLHASLTRQAGSISAIRAVRGMGGIGKTRAAIEYALRHQNEYTALLFVRAPDETALTANLAALTGLLRLPEETAADTDVRLKAVLRWMTDHPGWLLILDNVDSPEALRAAMAHVRALRNGHILLTSRLTGAFAQDIQVLDLGLLTPEDAVAYLLKATEGARRPGPDASAQAARLAEALDHLTLALVHAAAYIKERQFTFARYLSAWDANYTRVLAWASPEVTGYPLSLAQTWLTSVEQLTPPGRALLERLSFFANDPVPEFLMDVALPGTETAEGLDPLLDLQRFSLITRDPAAERFTIHRIVRDVTNRRLTTDPAVHKTRLTEALGWIAAAFEGHDPRDVRTWPRLAPLAPHAEPQAWAADKAGIADPTAFVMSVLATLFETKAAYARAEPLDRRALSIDEASLGPDHPSVARDLNNLAELLYATNRRAEAEPLYRRALAIGEASLGPDHPEVATGLNNLALLLSDTNRRAEAEPLYRRALAIGEASLGPDHPSVAAGLNNLAGLLRATNRLAEAEPLYRRALSIDEASLGPDHPSVARDLNNLALLLSDTNRLAEAEPLFRRALAIGEASFGPDHPNVATRLNNLARLLSDTNRLAEAEPLYRRALAIFEASLGPDHPSVAAGLNNLAGLLRATNRLAEAEPLYRRVVSIFEASFGPDHPNVATGLNNLALLLRATGRAAEAEPPTRRMLVIFLAFERATGHAHPHREGAIANYRGLLADLGRSATAIDTAIADARREAGLG
ncbi:MAG: tetratricopeptide repeat protein [Acetobacteraceae bacterium]|nr:tetratricopeptide repeat protein [Acetobacteraceae bacterium]